jgi:hypothetical protein
MHKKTITDVFLTKEAFIQYSIRLREEQAKAHGMTLEQWDNAIATQQTVSPNTQQSTEWNGPTSSFNG